MWNFFNNCRKYSVFSLFRMFSSELSLLTIFNAKQMPWDKVYISLSCKEPWFDNKWFIIYVTKIVRFQKWHLHHLQIYKMSRGDTSADMDNGDWGSLSASKELNSHELKVGLSAWQCYPLSHTSSHKKSVKVKDPSPHSPQHSDMLLKVSIKSLVCH